MVCAAIENHGELVVLLQPGAVLSAAHVITKTHEDIVCL